MHMIFTQMHIHECVIAMHVIAWLSCFSLRFLQAVEGHCRPGLVLSDPFIILPNFLGLGLGIAQVLHPPEGQPRGTHSKGKRWAKGAGSSGMIPARARFAAGCAHLEVPPVHGRAAQRWR